MKKYWPLLLITGILLAIIGMSQYANSTKDRHKEGGKHAKDASVTKHDDDKAGNDTEGGYQPPVWAKFVTWPEGVGAWAVILTLLAIAWQSIETRRAANAAIEGNIDAKSANAATLVEIQRQAGVMERQATVMEEQTKTLINSERAWVLIQPDQTIELVAIKPGMIRPYNRFRFTMANGGKTVARLRKLQAALACFPDDETEFPPTPTYLPQDDFAPEYCGVLAPHDDTPMTLGLNRQFDTDHIERIKQGTSQVFVLAEWNTLTLLMNCASFNSATGTLRMEIGTARKRPLGGEKEDQSPTTPTASAKVHICPYDGTRQNAAGAGDHLN